MRRYKKKVIITIIMIVSIVTFFFVFKNINKRYEELPEVKIKEIKNSKSFAIMVTNDTGDGYKEYQSKEDKWPGTDYVFSKAECIDNKGEQIDNAITFEEKTRTVILETEKTIYCTLYFDENRVLKMLRKNDPNKVISSELVGDLYRYQGVRTKEGEDETHKIVDNNYLCFGTNNAGECKDNPDKYMYRIIGITANGGLKVIKMTGVEESGVDTFLWNDTYYYDTTHGEESCLEGICPEWPDTLIYKRLNGLSKGSVSGSGFALSDKGNTDIFINNKNYPYMSEGNYWYNLIEDHNWMYGDLTSTSKEILNEEEVYGIRNDPLILYKIETGKLPAKARLYNSDNFIKYQWSKTITAKIGLMYLHDYYLAYDNVTPWDYWTNSGNSTERNQINWLLGNKSEFTISRGGKYASNHTLLPNGVSLMIIPYPRGTVSDYASNILLMARPVFYIKNGIELEGKGTESEPYIIPPQKNENNQIYYDYEYSGYIREFVAPEDGTYKLELWGASGGGTEETSGKGGYVSGYITLASGQKLYLAIGGQGIGLNGGYNGGGNADGTQSDGITGGGGATHIAKNLGLLKELNSNSKMVLIVAAGGGGGSTSIKNVKGGNAGGVTGEKGINTVSPGTGFMGYGGTETLAGTCPTGITGDCGGFGYGGSATGQQYGGAGGGAGYYGGSQSSRGHAGAGGGSSYTGGVTSYNGDQPKNISGSEEQPSPTGGSQTGNSGNGFAKITKIS